MQGNHQKDYKLTKGFIFDYGGTLDTAGRHWGKVIWHAYKKHGVKVSEQQFREAYVYAERQLGSRPIISPEFTFYDTLDAKLRIELEYLAAQNMPYMPAKDTDTLRKNMLEDIYHGVRQETAKSRMVLAEIKTVYPTALVSNFYGNINTVLREFKFDGLFDKVIESAVAGIRKPDHRIFILGAESLGLKPDETVVVGDSYDKDIIPAKQAGCHTVWLKGEGWTEKEYDENQPDIIINKLSEILTKKEWLKL